MSSVHDDCVLLIIQNQFYCLIVLKEYQNKQFSIPGIYLENPSSIITFAFLYKYYYIYHLGYIYSQLRKRYERCNRKLFKRNDSL